MNDNLEAKIPSVSGLVVKSIVAIDGPRVRFAADAYFFYYFIISNLFFFSRSRSRRRRRRWWVKD